LQFLSTFYWECVLPEYRRRAE